MERGVRDLDQLEERDADLPARRIGLLVLAALTIVGLIFAMGVVVGKAAKRPSEEADDPLTALSDGSKLEPTQDKAPETGNVDATRLRFPSALSDREERPEVLAALKAAAEEEAALGAQADDDGRPRELPSHMPAAMAAMPDGDPGIGRHGDDPLLRRSLPERDNEKRAPAGEEGTFTLHVISYKKPERARDFADALRDRGHEAFVTRAEVPERGVMWRVRIGPFPWRHLAERYRKKFEREEQMNTYIVRRDEDG